MAGRIVIDREVAKLTVNALEMFTAADMSKYYPALDIDSVTDPLKSTITGKLEIAVGAATTMSPGLARPRTVRLPL